MIGPLLAIAFILATVTFLVVIVRFGYVSRYERASHLRLREPDREGVEEVCGFALPRELAEFFETGACVEMVEFELEDSVRSGRRWFIGGFIPLTPKDVRRWTSITRAPGVPIAEDLDKGVYYVSRDGTVRLQSPNVDGRDVLVASSIVEFSSFSPKEVAVEPSN